MPDAGALIAQLAGLFPVPAGFPPYSPEEQYEPTLPRWIAVHNPRGVDAPTLGGDVPPGLPPRDAVRFIPRRASWPLWMERGKGAGRQGDQAASQGPEPDSTASPGDAGILYRKGEGIVALFLVTSSSRGEPGDYYRQQNDIALEALPRPVPYASLKSVIRPAKQLPKPLRAWATPHLANLQRTTAQFNSSRSWREVMTLIAQANAGWVPEAEWARTELAHAYASG